MKLNRKILFVVVLIIIGGWGIGYSLFLKDDGFRNYSDDRVSFTYPQILSIARDKNIVTLTHSIPHHHASSCDGRGDAPPLETFADFGLSLEVVDKGVQEYIESTGWPDWEYVSQNPFKGNNGTQGFLISPGAEGCGMDIYYIVISPKKTLIITRPFVPEFSPVNTDYQTYMNLPGVITPEKAEEYFLKITNSLKVTLQ